MTTKLLLVLGLLISTNAVSARFSSCKSPSSKSSFSTTQVISSQCGQVLPLINTTITANLVSGATAYRFKVTTEIGDGQSLEQVVTNATRTFNLAQMPSYAFATQYHIQVASYLSGNWQPYGADCTVTSPTPLTKIMDVQCGITLNDMSDVICASSVPYAIGYRFRVTNAINPSEVYFLDRSLREFRMNLIQGVSTGASYNVDVAVRNRNGYYLPYGELCTINTPVIYTKIQNSQCGLTLGAMSENIYANLVSNCTGYRFKITNASNLSDVKIIDRPLREFSMNLLTNVQYNTNYSVQVAIKFGHGSYLGYGPVCTIRTPGGPTPKIQLSQCEIVASNGNEMMYADPIPNATAYRFKLENDELGYSRYIDTPSRYYTLNMFNGLESSTAYTVKVAVRVNGIFSPYGKSCDVTTPGTASRITNSNQDKVKAGFIAVLYPNPFSDAFNINFASGSNEKATIKVYDITGRLLETKQLSTSEIASAKIGESYRSGVYNVFVSQGENAKIFRIIKR